MRPGRTQSTAKHRRHRQTTRRRVSAANRQISELFGKFLHFCIFFFFVLQYFFVCIFNNFLLFLWQAVMENRTHPGTGAACPSRPCIAACCPSSWTIWAPCCRASSTRCSTDIQFGSQRPSRRVRFGAHIVGTRIMCACPVHRRANIPSLRRMAPQISSRAGA